MQRITLALVVMRGEIRVVCHYKNHLAKWEGQLEGPLARLHFMSPLPPWILHVFFTNKVLIQFTKIWPTTYEECISHSNVWIEDFQGNETIHDFDNNGQTQGIHFISAVKMLSSSSLSLHLLPINTRHRATWENWTME